MIPYLMFSKGWSFQAEEMTSNNEIMNSNTLLYIASTQDATMTMDNGTTRQKPTTNSVSCKSKGIYI